MQQPILQLNLTW